jgi:hypothetical protein
MVSRALIVISLCCISALKLAGAGSTPEKLNGLLENSPFGVSRANATAGDGTTDPLEFRSVSEEKGKKYFSIYETAVHRSTWVELNDSVNGFAIKGYDATHDKITVEYHNKTLILPLKRAAAVAQASPSVSSGLPPLGNASVQGITSPSDPQRLQQIQEEIRRRRALRQPSMGLPPGSQPGPQPMPSSTPGSQSGPQPLPGTTGATSGPQPTPLPPGSQPGPQPMPSSNPGSTSGPQFPQFSPSNSSGPQPLPAKP